MLCMATWLMAVYLLPIGYNYSDQADGGEADPTLSIGQNRHAAGGSANLLLVFLVSTLVIACLIVTPAFSISFFVNPVVMHTFNAGWSFQLSSLVVVVPLLGEVGILFSRVIRTPFTRHWKVC